MTLFSEITQTFLLNEIQNRIDSSLAADETDTHLHGLLMRDHDTAREKRSHLETLKETIQALPEKNDEEHKKQLLKNLKDTKKALDAERQKTNREANATEQTLRILHDFITSLYNELHTLHLLNEPVSPEPLCDVYRAIISYLANRALNKAQETAGTQSLMHRFLYQPTITPNTAFLHASDELVQQSVRYIQDTLEGFDSTSEHFQRRKDKLANKELRALDLEHKSLREDRVYSWYGVCLPNILDPYIEAAKQNITHNQVTELSDAESEALELKVDKT